MELQTPIQYVKGVGPFMSKRLERLGIHTVLDLLFHIPARFDDFSLTTPINGVQEGETVTLRGTITTIKNIFTRNGKKIQEAVLTDSSGSISVIWFNQFFLVKALPVGTHVSLSGKIKRFANHVILETPTYEILDTKYEILNTIHTGRLVPVYPETEGVSSKWLRVKISLLLESVGSQIVDYLPKEIIETENVPSLLQALSSVHFPDNPQKAHKGRERLAFDELFLLHLTTLIRKKEWQNKKPGIKCLIDEKKVSEFINSLPFTLTNAQIRVIEEIKNDLRKEIPMNRLLEGDVGSGKTVVAALAAFIIFQNSASTVIMAPTELLAGQHFETIKQLVKPFNIPVTLVTASTKKFKKGSGAQNPGIIIGTHALLHRDLPRNVGLIVIDEQHRFGVTQRSFLRDKTEGITTAHLLTMTATPIPRTLALTIYGDLDLSLLNEMPKNRKVVKTWVVPSQKREGAYEWIRKQHTQSFILCPFIEESETILGVKAATVEFERLKKKVFPDLRLALLHGKMKSGEKEKILTEFRDKEYDILVTTPVVEVGIDIPSATIMVIEAAERFGLAQLHQLRGRVGRGNEQSYCLLFPQSTNPQTNKRLKYLETIHEGITLSEIDFKLRGPGDMQGTSQHGLPQLTAASLTDLELVAKTRNWAQKILNKDPELNSHPPLKQRIKKATIVRINPD